MIGAIVTVKGRKTRARVVRVLPAKLHEVGTTWNGWVEVDPPLNGFTRWELSELEIVRQCQGTRREG